MPKRIEAEKSFTTKTEGDQCIITFVPARSVGFTSFLVRIAFIPAYFVGFVLLVYVSNDTNSLVTGAVSGLSVVLGYHVLKHIGLEKIRKNTSRSVNRIVLTEDELRCHFGIYNREDIRGVKYVTPDTSFTYKGDISYAINKHDAQKRAVTQYAIVLEYGAKDVDVSGRILSQHQANDIAYFLACWSRDPDSALGKRDQAA